MLTVITGRGKTGKTRLLLEAVKACPATSMASRIVLVPEQLSHETERLLSELCGDAISFTAEVLSFTRLCDRVFARSGGGARPILDPGRTHSHGTAGAGRHSSAAEGIWRRCGQAGVFGQHSQYGGRAEILWRFYGVPFLCRPSDYGSVFRKAFGSLR